MWATETCSMAIITHNICRMHVFRPDPHIDNMKVNSLNCRLVVSVCALPIYLIVTVCRQLWALERPLRTELRQTSWHKFQWHHHRRQPHAEMAIIPCNTLHFWLLPSMIIIPNFARYQPDSSRYTWSINSCMLCVLCEQCLFWTTAPLTLHRAVQLIICNSLYPHCLEFLFSYSSQDIPVI